MSAITQGARGRRDNARVRRRPMNKAWLWLVLTIAALACAAHAMGDTNSATGGDGGGRERGRASELNPIAVLESAAQSLPGMGATTIGGGGAPGGGAQPLSTALNIVLLLTVMSLAPAVLILCTCFTRMVIVLGLLRQALGTQNLPPGQVIVGLALFITFVVMAPTAERMYDEGIGPYMRHEQTDYKVAWERTRQPLRDFMFEQIEASGNWSGVYMMLNYRGVDTSQPEKLTRGDVDMIALVPAYILSELKTAFLIGFRVYLPFLVIDMVISSMLISMGMLMLPPVLISLPFKLLLFVLVDGWQLVVGSLMTSVVQPEPVALAASMVMTGGP
jgi:flagellar biosynthetic protein FliP